VLGVLSPEHFSRLLETNPITTKAAITVRHPVVLLPLLEDGAVVAGVPTPCAVPVGAPHFGQAAARELIWLPHSVHSISATKEPATDPFQ
jgi:hypothetical protein